MQRLEGRQQLAAALRLIQLGYPALSLYLLDTYEGMTGPTEHDRSRTSDFSAAVMLKHASPKSKLVARAPLDEVKKNMASTCYPRHLIHFVKGSVEETVPAQAPERISLLRLDTDWYASTKNELTHLFPRISQGGVITLDDYGDWQGARRATDEYFKEEGRQIFFHRIDYIDRIAANNGSPLIIIMLTMSKAILLARLDFTNRSMY